MKNSHRNMYTKLNKEAIDSCPCINCLTFSICKAAIEENKMFSRVEYLFTKCSLLKYYYFKTNLTISDIYYKVFKLRG